MTIPRSHRPGLKKPGLRDCGMVIDEQVENVLEKKKPVWQTVVRSLRFVKFVWSLVG